VWWCWWAGSVGCLSGDAGCGADAGAGAAGGARSEGNNDTFVIQEHHARSLHWDVRLERDGVLVSWAVPKGLPLNPKDNRLAVHTEDHPIDYGSFQGDIPAGEYGGGTVILWDRGRYELEEWTDREVKVVFHGSRAEGRYVFFQTRGSDWMVHRMDGPPFPDWQPVPTDLTR
jgi:bifunctional non-homologous end joining protein LigD